MTPDERDMLMGLFDRMRAHGAIDKDSQAETLIFQEVRKIPDSAYMLVQSVLVQEQALEGAQAQIEQLQARVQELEAAGRASEQSSGGGFLGGMFGGKKAAPSRPASPWGDAPASVPSSVPSGRQGGPWGNAAAMRLVIPGKRRCSRLRCSNHKQARQAAAS